ncbi:MAG: type II toxin-antitoxin system VapC family toxin [Candidatus Methanodesulfokora sp.]
MILKEILIDTDVLIDVERGKAELPRAQIAVSCITLYEFIRGRGDYLALKEELEKAFTVVPLSNDVLIKAVEIYRELKSSGEVIDERDLLIGATAIALNIPLKTRNRSHYERLAKYGLKLL